MKYFLSIIIIIANTFLLHAQQWKEVGPILFPVNETGQINGIGRVTQLKFHPSVANKMYITSASGGLYYSQDTGHVWQNMGTDNLVNTSLASVCVDNTNDQIIYIGTGDPNYYSADLGIYKTINGGATWTPANATIGNRMAVDILMSSTNNLTLVAATNNGIYKTTDGAATWTLTNAPGAFTQMVQLPNSTTLLAVTNNSLLYRSTNFGTTWTNITATNFTQIGADGMRLGVSASNANIVYILSNGNNGVIYKSINGGLNFTQIYSSNTVCLVCYNDDPANAGQGNYDLALCVDPADASHLYVAAHCLWESVDAGITWQQKTDWPDELHTDHHQFVFSPYNNAQLWSVNDGGLWLRQGLNDSLWQPMSDGITATEVYKAANSGVVRKLISAGTQDNGEVYADVTGWHTNRGGDWGSRMAFDYTPENSVYYLEKGDKRSFTPDAYGSYNSPYVSTNNSRIAFCKALPNMSILGKDSVWISSNINTNTPTWQPLINSTIAIRDIVISSADSNKAFIINSSKIYTINNILSTPIITSVNVPSAASVRGSIATVKSNANIVYASCNAKMYRSADGGVTWSNVTYNLPAVNILKIYNDDYSTNENIFVCSGNSIFTKSKTDTLWKDISSNLPKIANITDFMLYNDSTIASKLRVSYYGRGVWEYKLHPNYGPVADFNASQTFVCAGQAVTFNNLSVDDSLTYSWSFAGGTPATSTLQNPVITYNTAGIYNVLLTTTNPHGSNTKTITNYIEVINTANTVDNAPAKCIAFDGSASAYANAGTMNVITNTATLMCWIKPNGPQNDWAGLIFARGNSASGISIKSNNEIRYHWNDNGYGFSSGLFAPDNQWTHCALVVTPTNVTIYVNGKAAVNTTTTTMANFNIDDLSIGRDNNGSTRRYKGEIDEVCFYNRALTQNEIREQMHLVKNVSNAAADKLLGYWQMNNITSGNTILNKVNCDNQLQLGSALQLVNSTAPFGSGKSERKTITTAGAANFANADINLNFTSGILPNGEVCATHLTVSPDEMPTGTAASGNYWILDNYGTNTTITPLTSFQIFNAGILGGTASQFSLYNRTANNFGATWGTTLGSATSITTGVNGSAIFNGTNNITKLGQFVMAGPYEALGIIENGIANNFKIFPNPATDKLFFESKNETPFTITIYNTKGEIVTQFLNCKNVQSVACKNWARGNYLYEIKSGTQIVNGQISIK
jgi:PKD repeat protein/photosystem II stability/assembly factor-like uncharacterized protein